MSHSYTIGPAAVSRSLGRVAGLQPCIYVRDECADGAMPRQHGSLRPMRSMLSARTFPDPYGRDKCRPPTVRATMATVRADPKSRRVVS